MKAAVLVKNKKIEIQDIELNNLEENSCRIAVKYCGICSSDIQRSFEHGAYFYPLIMGHEFAGVVEEVGSNVKDIKKGDKVGVFPLVPCFECEPCKNKDYQQCKNYNYYGSRTGGAFAEFIDVKEWNLIKLPNEIDMKDAALLEPIAVAIHAIKKANINKDATKSIAILGAGFIGLIMVQIIAKRYPNTTISIIDKNDFKLKFVDDVAKTYNLKTNEEWEEFISKNNFDIVFEATGCPSLFVNSIKMVNRKGKIIWLGNITGNLNIEMKTVSSILRKEIEILGVWNSSYKNFSDDWIDAISLIENDIKPSNLVTHIITLEEIQKIMDKLYNHKKRVEEFPFIKILIDISKG